MSQAYYLTVRCDVREDFQMEEGDNELETISGEIVAALDEVGVDAYVVDIGDTLLVTCDTRQD